MRFHQKVAIQRVLSVLPGGENVNFLLQRHLTHVLPRNDAGFANKVLRGHHHWNRIRQFGPDRPPAALRLQEIGAGYDLIIPFTLWACGVEEQWLFDLRQRFRWEIVHDTLRRIGPMLETEFAEGDAIQRLPTTIPRSAQDLERAYGFHFRALDATRSGMPDDNLDAATNTSTLEHLPADILPALFAEWRRVLVPGGIVSAHIDLRDHYAYSDRQCSIYNFLGYSSDEWRALNPPIHHQNRLRYPEYLRLGREAGFEIVDLMLEAPTGAHALQFETARFHPHFTERYTREELAPEVCFVVFRKPQ